MSSANERIIDEFHANAGRVGGYFEGRTLLLLHHRGAKTGTERVNPVGYQRVSDDRVAVFASKGGAPTNPDWYYNVVANPDVSVEIGTRTFAARAHVAEGEERELIWERQKRDLRHSLAANAFALKLTPVEVSKLLRHANPAITLLIYAGLAGDHVAVLGEKLAALGG